MRVKQVVAIGGVGTVALTTIALIADFKSIFSTSSPTNAPKNSGVGVIGDGTTIHGGVTINPAAPTAAPSVHAAWDFVDGRVEIRFVNQGTASIELVSLELVLPAPIRMRIVNSVRPSDKTDEFRYTRIRKVPRAPRGDDFPSTDPLYVHAGLYSPKIINNSGDAISSALPRAIGPNGVEVVFVNPRGTDQLMSWNNRLNEYEVRYDMLHDLPGGEIVVVAGFSVGPDMHVRIPVSALR